MEDSWDHVTDIVCVGGGAAACTAAVIARANGNNVILVERAPAVGGTTNKSGGVAWMPNNFLLQQQGIDDAKADCMRYMVRFAYPQRYTPDSPTLGVSEAEYKLIEAFYDNANASMEALKKTGAIDFGTFDVGVGVGAPPDYADHLPENKVPAGRSIVPIMPDGKPSAGRVGDGIFLIDPLAEWLEANSAPILVDHRVTKVIQHDGRVIGVEADNEGKTVRIQAKKGVIFGTGGYAQNHDLIDIHQKALYGACAVPEATGDLIPIAGAAGAIMGDLGTAWRSQVVFEEALDSPQLAVCAFVLPADSMLVVNKHGKRVFNEKRNYNDRTEVHFQYDPVAIDYPNQLLMMIFDERSRDAFGGQYPISLHPEKDPYTIQGADLGELSANIAARLKQLSNRSGGYALSPAFTDELEQTVARFNEYAKTGIDPEFGRGQQSYDKKWQAFFSMIREGSTQEPNTLPNTAMYPFRDEGPYYAIILAAGALDTSGGPMINEKAQILGADGKPIPGLYGAGNCIASPSREAYFGAGGTIGLCMAYGYIAAMNAGKETA